MLVSGPNLRSISLRAFDFCTIGGLEGGLESLLESSMESSIVYVYF
jgi:hypothetical protein